MRYLLLLWLLFGALAWAQETPAPTDVPPEYRPPSRRDSDESVPASAASVTSDAAVITIKGLCPQSAPTNASASNPSCQVVITRAEFEKLTDALLTNMKPSRKRQLANAYPDLLAMAHEAEARGLENSQRFQERLAFARVQLLSQELVHKIEEESANVSDEDLEDYYRNHSDLFETASLERIFVPNRKRVNSLPQDKTTAEPSQTQSKEAADAMIKVANELRTKAAAGEPFLKLEQEAYEAAGLGDVPPNPSLGQVRRSSLPSAHVSVFDLKPGEVSGVISDSTGLYIYKLDAKQKPTLETVKDQIRKTLQNQRREAAIQAVQRPITAEFNEAYFGTIEKPHAGAQKSK